MYDTIKCIANQILLTELAISNANYKTYSKNESLYTSVGK